ncbi:helix-turn-helix domain-containing protein [Rhodococcus sp. WS3]|uniref:helix-turn-helix domain-containing protein n=1 Tax=unclassified Rhodococcus (in: high G+C Gram-positive bacteria) TaxID=192944 RepID=UPI0005D38ED6|nr:MULTISPECIES: XRE family transcriptional regulator [unclassified Rhodococcus (in: high G+C Gram-positive bacteria)]KJF19195.1 HTH-type transcriptional regulator PuuR [Rhodococcus sp. AD45]ROZ42820.1 helix-turn-helix domain-containing protein [Rhodococcus sp. WS3]RZL20790.1 MAG: helix-turn-helix domain-containing protein [Rhodococcus sp. (in: high G+C Gram-positive bacteria)]
MRPLPISPGNDVRIGPKLRAARTARGYTLEQVAEATGLTKGFLSRVERDETSPSVTSLSMMCRVMSIDVGSLFSMPDLSLVRGEEAPAINLGGTGVRDRLMTPRGQAMLQLIHSTIEPGGSGGSDLYTINCEVEVLYVLKGSVELFFTNRVQNLSAGDALTFAGGEPHTWANSAKRSAEVVWVLVPAPWSGSN